MFLVKSLIVLVGMRGCGAHVLETIARHSGPSFHSGCRFDLIVIDVRRFVIELTLDFAGNRFREVLLTRVFLFFESDETIGANDGAVIEGSTDV